MKLDYGEGRAPCCDWKASRAEAEFFGDLFQHWRDSETNVLVAQNTTVVANYQYTAPGSPGDPFMPPYARPEGNLGAYPSDCRPGQPVCGNLGSGLPECGPNAITNTFGLISAMNFARCLKYGHKRVQAKRRWHGRFGFFTCDGSLSSPSQTKYLSSNRSSTGSASGSSVINDGGLLNSSFSFSRNKQVAGHVLPNSGEVVLDSIHDTTSATHSSNGATQSYPDVGSIDGIPIAQHTNGEINAIIDLIWGLNCECGSLNGPPVDHIAGPTLGGANRVIVTIGGTDYDQTTPAGFLFFIFAVPDASNMSGVSDTGASCSFSFTNPVSTAGDHFVNLTTTVSGSISISDSNITVTYNIDSSSDTNAFGESGSSTGEMSFTAALGGVNTSQTVHDDVVSMLALWPLDDDILYPWRTDPFTKRAPLVTRKERSTATPSEIDGVSATMDDYRHPIAGSGTDTDQYSKWEQMPWVDMTCYQWVWSPGRPPLQSLNTATDLVLILDGSIVGEPMIMRGLHGERVFPDKVWDGTHANYVECFSGDHESEGFYIESYGAWNVDDSMPATATQWTTKNDEATDSGIAGTRPGHWLNEDPSGYIHIQKEAVIVQPAPSQNFFGPSGPARYAFDTTKVACVNGVSGAGPMGTDLPLNIGLANNLEIASGDVANTVFRTWNVPGVPDALWKGTQDTVASYHLTQMLVDLTGYADPEAFLLLGGGEDSGQLGVVRFPDAWPIQGRAVVISATQNGSNVDLVTEAMPWLRTGDKVSFVNVAGLGAGLTVTVTDSTHISVPGTVLVYNAGGFVVNNGAPDPSWYDQRVKGDFVQLTWKAQGFRSLHFNGDFRANQQINGMPASVTEFDQVQHCLCWKPCCPSVACASPNGETGFTNAIVGWPYDTSSVNFLDDTYGCTIQGIFQVGMEELYAQPGIKPCTGNGPIDQAPNCDGWIEDDGSCEENQPCDPEDGIALGNLFYDNAAIVEARLGLPAGAPALPPGFFLGYLTLDQLSNVPPPPGNILTPPAPGVNNQGGPWVQWKTKVDCVERNGRFAFLYIDEVIF